MTNSLLGVVASNMPSTMNMYEFLGTHPLILAPMAGVSDMVYRQLCLEQGASLTFTEMVSAKGLQYGGQKTRDLLSVGDDEEEVGVQLFGHEPDTMAAQAVTVEEILGDRLAYLDINMGCPARKIITKGDGASLMECPKEAAAIVSAVSQAASVPVTCKFRRGFEEGHETAVEFAKLMETSGAAMVTVHGRYAKQMYRGQADWDVISRVKQAVSIPVIGNGDVVDADSYLALRHQTGCDAVMIARGSQGNPWIFAQCKAAYEGRPVPALPSFEERLAMCKRHAKMLADIHGGRIVMMRTHAMHYLHGMPGASVARKMLAGCVTYEDFAFVLDQLLASLNQNWEGED